MEERFQELFEQVDRHRDYSHVDEYKALNIELLKSGYEIEHGYGWYLHTPDGRCLVLDYWNEDA